MRAPASSSQRSRPDTAAAKRGAETGCARPMPLFRIGSMSGAVQPALVRRGDSSVSPVRPERRQTKGVARVSSGGLSLSRERWRATKFELRLRPHNTRRWSTDEGDCVLSMRGWPLFRSLLSCGRRRAGGFWRLADRRENAREACRRACLDACRRVADLRGSSPRQKQRTKTRAASRPIGPIAPSGAMVWTPSDRASQPKCRAQRVPKGQGAYANARQRYP